MAVFCGALSWWAEGPVELLLTVVLMVMLGVPLRYIRGRRKRRADQWLISRLQEASELAQRGEKPDVAIRFPMGTRKLHLESFDAAEIGQVFGARMRQFANPEARLEAGMLIIEQGPARRAVVPIARVSGLAAAKPAKLRPRRSRASYYNNARQPAVVIDLRQETEVFVGKPRLVSSLAVEVSDPRTFLESLGEAAAIEPDYASLDAVVAHPRLPQQND